MKKILLIGLGCLALTFTSKAYAVWPPSVSLAEDSAPAAAASETKSLSATSQRASEIVDKLEADEHRLQLILRDIEEDKKKLKENKNGHSVR